MEEFGRNIVAVLTAIVGLAIVAVLVSNRANTAGVISSTFNGLGGAISAATGPVSGGNGFSTFGNNSAGIGNFH